MRAGALGFYLENIERFHRLRDEATIIGLMGAHMAKFVGPGLGRGDEIDVQEGDRREKFPFQRLTYPRDPNFARNVLAAYRRACCICGRQMGIVQAAHIIPHAEADSNDSVNNGLGMCVEHHRLYDDALLLPGPGQRLVFNQSRAEYLRQTDQQEGIDAVEGLHGNEYRIPDSPDQQPRDEFLARGLEARLVG